MFDVRQSLLALSCMNICPHFSPKSVAEQSAAIIAFQQQLFQFQ
jgi:hypothetical protein